MPILPTLGVLKDLYDRNDGVVELTTWNGLGQYYSNSDKLKNGLGQVYTDCDKLEGWTWAVYTDFKVKVTNCAESEWISIIYLILIVIVWM